MPVSTQAIRLKYRRTKIIATLGPSSNSAEAIASLIAAGVNVFRLNMSHGTHESHAQTHALVREVATKLDKPIGILVDLAGPKIRTGVFANGQIELQKGQEVTITIKDVEGQPGLIPSQYEGIVRDVSLGSRVLLDDGQLELEVMVIDENELLCKVVYGGILGNHKGINLPGSRVSAPALTDKDREDIRFSLGLGVDFFALSFVKHADDVAELRKIIGRDIKIIAKIETEQSLANAEEIVDAADGIMIARGDLGSELPQEDVPIAQDQLIMLARDKMKPVIVATQMLETMIEKPKPTRAEVTDVFYAVQSGADAIMLSAETATGKFPLQTVQIMDRIARHTEAHLWKKGFWGEPKAISQETPKLYDALSRAIAMLSKELMVRGVFVISKNQAPFLALSSAKPSSPIVAITDNIQQYRQLSLFWGVIPVFFPEPTIEVVQETALKLGLGKAKNSILLVQGDVPSLRVLEI